MDERSVTELIDGIIRAARIPSARERAELRRELESHFAEVDDSPEALHAAIERFGDPGVVSGALERAHRHSQVLTHIARVLVASLASAFVAFAIQLAVNLRRVSPDTVALRPSFLTSASFSTMLVIALVAAWELDIDSLCARLERNPVRLLTIVAGLASAMLLFHASQNSWLHPGRALFESSIDAVIWTCTIAILARADRAFARVFTPVER